MDRLALLLFLLAFVLLTGGVALLSVPAGLITAGVLVAAAGVMSLKTGPAGRDGDNQ